MKWIKRFHSKWQKVSFRGVSSHLLGHLETREAGVLGRARKKKMKKGWLLFFFHAISFQGFVMVVAWLLSTDGGILSILVVRPLCVHMQYRKCSEQMVRTVCSGQVKLYILTYLHTFTVLQNLNT